jgi:hypothetical protein
MDSLLSRLFSGFSCSSRLSIYLKHENNDLLCFLQNSTPPHSIEKFPFSTCWLDAASIWEHPTPGNTWHLGVMASNAPRNTGLGTQGYLKTGWDHLHTHSMIP